MADELTLTIRVHDPREKRDSKRAADWQVVKFERADLELTIDEFCEKYIKPAILQGVHFKKP